MHQKTLYDKLWNEHLVTTSESTDLIYIDRHLLHEVTSPQAFEGLELSKRQPWRSNANLAMADHNIPTKFRDAGIKDAVAKLQVETLYDNCEKFNIPNIPLDDDRQGIVHVVGPEIGATLPGMTLVCGDSHTATHGALGALAFGIGTSEVEHVLATQCLAQNKSKNMLIRINGSLTLGVSAKDVVLFIIGKIGTAGGTGYAIEFSGNVISNFSIEERMTICNMAIEAGARSGLISVDQKTLDYVRNTSFSPKGDHWEKAEKYWRTLVSDPEAKFDKIVEIDASTISPQVTWGTSPEMVAGIENKIPPATKKNQRALEYMGLQSGIHLKNIYIDTIFIGSCTNSRIEDLREAAFILKGQKISDKIKTALVVPGSGSIKSQAEKEGLDLIFQEAGFEWREPGCSMCLAMNADRLTPGERCASTSNRNFEGRQGPGGRTHLVSPAMAAAAAIHGHFIDVREYYKQN